MLSALQVLKNAHCEAVLIDGSFVTSKPDPGDYGGVWEVTSKVRGDWIDPILLKFDDNRKAMKAKYSGELFPSSVKMPSGQTFSDFFQSDRNGNPKGVVRTLLRTLP